MTFDVCEVFDDELGQWVEYLNEFESKSEAIEFARNSHVFCPNSIWVIQVDGTGCEKVVFQISA